MKTLRINDPVRAFFGSKKNLLILYPLLIVLAKIIRYTVLKKTLVDSGVGHTMISSINSHSTSFSFFEGGVTADASGNAAFIFDKLNILGLNSYLQFEIFITIVFNISIMYFLCFRCIKKYSSLQCYLLLVFILALNIFDFTLAKEPVQICYFLPLLYFLKDDNHKALSKWVVSSLLILFASVTFRSYYILMLGWSIAIYFVIIFFENKKIKIKHIIYLLSSVLLIYIILLMFVKQVSPSVYKELLRVRTRESSAVTDIRAIFVSDNIVLFCVNYLLTIIRLIFPIELIRFGFKYIVFVIVQITISWAYCTRLKNIKNLLKSQKIAFCLFSGFILMSAAFEPDFGSWIRHEAAVFPVIFILCGLIKGASKNPA